MARNEFESEVGNFLSSIFPFCHRLPDAAFNRDLGRQTSKKPFDYFGYTHCGQAFIAEVKRVKQPRFDTGLLKKHQRHQLRLTSVDPGAHAWLFINFRTMTAAKAVNGSRCGLAYWMPYAAYEQVEDMAARLDRVSITPDMIPDSYRLDRVTGGWLTPEGHIFYRLSINDLFERINYDI